MFIGIDCIHQKYYTLIDCTNNYVYLLNPVFQLKNSSAHKHLKRGTNVAVNSTMVLPSASTERSVGVRFNGETRGDKNCNITLCLLD